MSDFTRMPDDRFDEFATEEASLTEEQRQRRNALMEIIRAGQIGDDDGDGVFGTSKGGVSKIVSLKEKIRHTSRITGAALKGKIKDMSRRKKKDEKEKPPPPVHLPVFGVSISLAVQRSRLCQNVELPTVFRICIDFIEENGLDYEGIYRISGVKSKIEALKVNFDKGKLIDVDFADINAVAGVFKLYLRELPENILTSSLLPSFEQAARDRDLNQIQFLINQMPQCNRLVLLWLLLHFQHVINQSSQNKMSAPNLVLVFSPTLNISQNLLNTLILNVSRFIGNETILKYDTQSAELKQRERFMSLSDVGTMDPQLVTGEISRLENVIVRLHSDLRLGQLTEKETAQREDEIWEVQRLLTQLKRKQRSDEKERIETEDEEGEEDLEEEVERLQFLREEYSKQQRDIQEMIQTEMEAIQKLKDELALYERSPSPMSPDSLLHPDAQSFDFAEDDAFSIVQLKEEYKKLQDIRDQHVADINLERGTCAQLQAKINLLTRKGKRKN